VVCAALAHAARRQILLTIHFWGGVMSAGEIARRFGHSWPTTTRHLRLLTDAGLLTQERNGRARLYRLNVARLAVASDWLLWFTKAPEIGIVHHGVGSVHKLSAIDGHRPLRRTKE